MISYTNRTPYDFGRVMFEFINENYGASGVIKTIEYFRRSSLFRRFTKSKGRFFKMFGLTQKEFNFNFKKISQK